MKNYSITYETKLTISVWARRFLSWDVFGTIGIGGWRQVLSVLTACRHTFQGLYVELKWILWILSILDFLNFVFDAVVFWLFWRSAAPFYVKSQFNNFSSSFSPITIKQCINKSVFNIYICVCPFTSYFLSFFEIENTILNIFS